MSDNEAQAPQTHEELLDFFGIKDGPVPLHPDLEAAMEDGAFGKSIKHPLCFSIIHTEMLNKRMNDFYEHKLKAVKEAVAEGDWSSYLWLHERPYRFDAFLEIMDNLDDQEYWELLGSIWTDTENAWQNLNDWLYVFEGRDGHEALLGEDEKSWYEVIPDRLTVYRGFTLEHDDAVNGLSWTANPKKALWFARRFNRDGDTPAVAIAQIAKASIIGLFLGRDESEVVLNPENLENLNVVTADDFEKAQQGKETP